MLSIARDNLQFCPIFNFGGMKLDHDFFHVSKLSEDQKKVFTGNWRVFVPEITWRSKNGPNIIQRSDADHSPIIGGDADVDHSQIIWGM